MEGWKAKYYVPLLFFEKAGDNKTEGFKDRRKDRRKESQFYVQFLFFELSYN